MWSLCRGMWRDSSVSGGPTGWLEAEAEHEAQAGFGNGAARIAEVLLAAGGRGSEIFSEQIDYFELRADKKTFREIDVHADGAFQREAQMSIVIKIALLHRACVAPGEAGHRRGLEFQARVVGAEAALHIGPERSFGITQS